MRSDTLEHRVVVVTGRPSWVRVAVCTVGAAGAMTFVIAAVFGVGKGANPIQALLRTVSMSIGWVPMTFWAAWWTAPAVLAAGILLAFLTHRYRLPVLTSPSEGRRTRWRRIGRLCTAALIVCGAWTVLAGAIMLL